MPAQPQMLPQVLRAGNRDKWRVARPVVPGRVAPRQALRGSPRGSPNVAARPDRVAYIPQARSGRRIRLCRARGSSRRTSTGTPERVPPLPLNSMLFQQLVAYLSWRGTATHYFFELVFSRATRSPCASFTASSLAQKCMKNRRGSSVSMWLCNAVTWIPFSRSA